MLVVVTGTMAVLLGTAASVVDLAAGMQSRAKQQAADDAAALAAAYALAGTPNASTISSTAIDYAGRNGCSVDASDVAIWNQADGTPAVTVRSKESVPTSFAKLLGLPAFDVGAAASATIRSVAELPKGSVPFGVPADKGPDGKWRVLTKPYGAYEPVETGCTPTKLILEVSPRCTPEGNFLALGLEGDSVSTYESTIVNGTTKPLAFGTAKPAEAGSDPTPTIRALRERLARGGDASKMVIPLIKRSEFDNTDWRDTGTVIGAIGVQVDSVDSYGRIAAHMEPIVVAAPAGPATGAGTPGVLAAVLIDTPAP
jgi:hypothetical protein